MPLATIEIPRNLYDTLPKESREESAVAVCNQALDSTLQGLKIPDLEDREYRVALVGDDEKSRLSIEFTCGTDEYETGEIFNPAEEQIHATGVEVQASAQRSEFNVAETEIISWRDTTFIEREEGTIEPTESLSPGCGDKVRKAKVTLTLSPDATERILTSQAGRELESSKSPELDAANTIGEGLSLLIAEALRLPENTERSVKVSLPLLAETHIAVDVDLEVSGTISSEDRLLLAKAIESHLNSNEPTSQGIGTIWVRQGQPAKDTITSEDTK